MICRRSKTRPPMPLGFDTAMTRLASAKDSADAALAMLRQWVIEAEADEEG